MWIELTNKHCRVFKHPSTMSQHKIAWKQITNNYKVQFKRHPSPEKLSQIATMFQLEKKFKKERNGGH